MENNLSNCILTWSNFVKSKPINFTSKNNPELVHYSPTSLPSLLNSAITSISITVVRAVANTIYICSSVNYEKREPNQDTLLKKQTLALLQAKWREEELPLARTSFN